MKWMGVGMTDWSLSSTDTIAVLARQSFGSELTAGKDPCQVSVFILCTQTWHRYDTQTLHRYDTETSYRYDAHIVWI